MDFCDRTERKINNSTFKGKYFITNALYPYWAIICLGLLGIPDICNSDFCSCIYYSSISRLWSMHVSPLMQLLDKIGLWFPVWNGLDPCTRCRHYISNWSLMLCDACFNIHYLRAKWHQKFQLRLQCCCTLFTLYTLYLHEQSFKQRKLCPWRTLRCTFELGFEYCCVNILNVAILGI